MKKDVIIVNFPNCYLGQCIWLYHIWQTLFKLGFLSDRTHYNLWSALPKVCDSSKNIDTKSATAWWVKSVTSRWISNIKTSDVCLIEHVGTHFIIRGTGVRSCISCKYSAVRVSAVSKKSYRDPYVLFYKRNRISKLYFCHILLIFSS